MPSVCIQCGTPFTTPPGEDALRNAIAASMKLDPFPAPRRCRDCRLQQKMAWRNERILYRRPCDATGREIVSAFPADAPFPVYDRTEWFSDRWNAEKFGRAFDPSQPFFEQFGSLLKTVPRAALGGKNTENCDYCNYCFDSRNCYVTHCCYLNSESLLYCYWSLESKDCLECSFTIQCERCAFCTDCNHAYGCLRCRLCHDCSDCTDCFDCRGCHDCVGCSGLRHKQYYIWNEPHTKEEYRAILATMERADPAPRLRALELRQSLPHQSSIQEKTEGCSGDYIFESQNCMNAFQTFRSRDCINLQDADYIEDTLDSYHCGWSNHVYQAYSPVRLVSSAFCAQCWDGSDLLYCDNCQSCSHCFGCCGLNHREYCALNVQYTKEQYEEQKNMLIGHMRASGEFGEFFPMSLSPFGYNESLAMQHFPIAKEAVRANGWKWREALPFTTGRETIAHASIPQDIDDVPETILQEVFACEQCQRNYRIIAQELQWYRSLQLPPPQLCPECRYNERNAERNTRHLWDRTCANCGVMIQTTYGPERPEIVYCEACYLHAVY